VLRRPLLSIDISYPHGTQQQDSKPAMPLLQSNDGTDGRAPDHYTELSTTARTTCVYAYDILIVIDAGRIVYGERLYNGRVFVRLVCLSR